MTVAQKLVKAAKWGATGVLTVGVIISIGLLSYCGMLALTPSIALAWTAFILAGVVDGEVFLQNIAGGIDSLDLLGKRGLPTLITHTLDDLLENEPDPKTASAFEKEYYAQRAYVAGFAHKKLTDEQKREYAEAKKRLHRMQKIFMKHLLDKAAGKAGNAYLNHPSCEDRLVKPILAQLSSLKRKAWYLRISAPISLMAGIGFGFATAAALDAAFVGMSALLTFTIWPLAAIACVGYAFLIYRTMTNMIRSDTFAKWRDKTKAWFKRDNAKESLPRYALRVTALGLVLGLAITVGVLATLATAGTWWIAVKNGALLLPALSAAANWIRNIFVPVAAGANLAFTIKNTMTTMDQVAEDINSVQPVQKTQHAANNAKQFFANKEWRDNFIKEKREKYFGNKSLIEIFNPFRIIAAAVKLPFMCVMFIGHTIAIGLIGDRAPGLNTAGTIASAVFGALADGFVDYDYIMGREHKHDARHPENNHSHGVIPKLMLNTLLSPVLLLASIWDFAVGDKTREPNHFKRFATILKGNFGIHGHEKYKAESNPKPVVSTTYLQEEMKYRLGKQKEPGG